jgi:adenylate cyclase
MQRRLAAIPAGDMVGYGRLISADEAGTLLRQKALRASLIDPAIARQGGRIVKVTGDGLLAGAFSAAD